MAGISTLPPGTILGDRQYRILAVRGQGSFGITYTGWDFSLERTVAIKECFPAEICTRDAETGQIHARSPELEDAYLMAMADLHKEARTLAQLNHRNIVQVHAVFAANGSLFCVMHYAEGDTLRDKLDAAEDADTPLPAAETTVWLTKLLGALQYMHRGGVIHRDIKPANIVFDEEGEPLLVDFGAAVNLTTLTHTLTQGEFSAAYAAPEQLANKGNIGPWTDLFALAATWYEVLTNCQAEETIRRMMEDTLDSLDQFPIGSQEPLLAAAVMRCLALKPQERCQSAQEWLDMLAGAQPPAGEPARGRIDTTARRRKAYLFGGAAAAALLLAAGTTALLMSRGTDTPPATTPPGTGPTTPTTQPKEPQPPARPAAGKEELFRQALEHYKIDELISKHEELAKKYRQLKRDQAADRKQIRDRALQDAMQDRDFGSDRPDYLHQANDKLKDLNAEYAPQLKALEDQNFTLFLKICNAENDLSAGKGWPDVIPQEEPLLPLVRSMLADYIRDQTSTFTFSSLQDQPVDSHDNEEIRLSAQFLNKMLDISERGLEQQQIAEDAADKRKKQTGEEKVGRMLREHYGVDTLLQLDREIRQAMAELPEQLEAETDRRLETAKETAATMPADEVDDLVEQTLNDLDELRDQYRTKGDELQERHRTEVGEALDRLMSGLQQEQAKSWLGEEELPYLTQAWINLTDETMEAGISPYFIPDDYSEKETEFREEMKQLKTARAEEESSNVDLAVLDKKAREHYKVKELHDTYEALRSEWESLPDQATAEFTRIRDKAVAEGRDLLPDALRKHKAAVEAEFDRARQSYLSRADALEEDYRTRVLDQLVEIESDITYPPHPAWLSSAEQSRLKEATATMLAEFQAMEDAEWSYKDPCLPFLNEWEKEWDKQREAAYEREDRLKEEKKKARAAAAQRLFDKVVDQEKIRGWRERHAELDKQRTAAIEEFKEKLRSLFAYWRPKLRQARGTAEERRITATVLQQISALRPDYDYRVEDLSLASNREICSPLGKYAASLAKGKGLSGLTEEEKGLLKDVADLLRKLPAEPGKKALLSEPLPRMPLNFDDLLLSADRDENGNYYEEVLREQEEDEEDDEEVEGDLG